MLDPKSFTHPEDEAALRTLMAVPGFAVVVKLFLKLGYEKMMHGVNMGSKIRLSPTQLPEVYNRLPPICRKMGIAEPEFYLESNPTPNACTFGDTQIFICVTSGLLEDLDDDEINSVIAHECGHIAGRHVLYHTIADWVLAGIDKYDLFGVGKLLSGPLSLAFFYWSRKSELSADRAAALVMGVDAVVRTHVRLSGGPKAITGGINLSEWVQQADAYDAVSKDSAWNKTLQGLAAMGERTPVLGGARARDSALERDRAVQGAPGGAGREGCWGRMPLVLQERRFRVDVLQTLRGKAEGVSQQPKIRMRKAEVG